MGQRLTIYDKRTESQDQTLFPFIFGLKKRKETKYVEKQLKFNQCQDCGCPGAKLIIEDWDSRYSIVKCPYCGRKGVPFPKPSRGDGKTITRIVLMLASWNSYNRENKEGLA